MKTKTEFKDWIPLISKLLYPILALVIILIYNSEISDFYNKKIMDENTDLRLEVAGFAVEIKQKAEQVMIQDLGFSSLGLKARSDIEVHSEQAANEFVTKSTGHKLKGLLAANETKEAYQTLIVQSGKNFSVELLKSYIYQLGIKYVAFVEEGKYFGLIDSKLFINQFSEFDRILSYNNLISEVIGINKISLNKDNTVLEILEKFNQENISELGITNDEGELQYIVERETIISKLVASIITDDAEQPD